MTVQPWMIEILIAVNVAVLSALGGVIWAAYRVASNLRVVLHGAEDEGGFIQTTREATDELSEEQAEICRQLKLQGRLLNELAYALADIATELDDADADVDIERVKELNDRVTDDRWRKDDD